jgi:hypothetical protein
MHLSCRSLFLVCFLLFRLLVFRDCPYFLEFLPVGFYRDPPFRPIFSGAIILYEYPDAEQE